MTYSSMFEDPYHPTPYFVLAYYQTRYGDISRGLIQLQAASYGETVDLESYGIMIQQLLASEGIPKDEVHLHPFARPNLWRSILQGLKAEIQRRQTKDSDLNSALGQVKPKGVDV